MTTRRNFIAIAALTLAASSVSAQSASTSVRPGLILSPAFSSWAMSDAIMEDSARGLLVTGVSQMLLPFAVVIPLARQWTLDAAGAYVQGSVKLQGGRTLQLNGPTDVRVRLVGRLLSDHLLLTLGATVPTGKTKLSGESLDAARIVGAPALGMPAPVLGTGFGSTAGLVLAQKVGAWGVAIGTSYEMRGSYSPVEASIAGVKSPTDLNPADAFHLSFGADRLVGQSHLSLLVVGDVYGDDKITLGAAGERLSSTFQLGPSIRSLLQLELAARGYRELTLFGQVRHRSKFKGVDGTTTPGSDGTAIDAGFSALKGVPGRVGLIFRADLTVDSGLEVDNTIATAGATTGGVTLGVSLPMGSGATLEPFARLNLGQLDTGPQSTSLRGFAAGLTLAFR